MRKVWILGLLSLIAAGSVPARQHAIAVPAAAAPAVHAAVVAPVAASHIAPAHVPAPVHPGSRPPATVARQGVPHKNPPHPVKSPAPTPLRNNPPTATYLPAGFSSCSNYPAPGYGYNYNQVVATHPNWGACNAMTGVILPFFGGAIYVPVADDVVGAAQEQAQEIASNDQQDSNVQALSEEPAGSSSPSSRSHSSSYSEPLADYVFVQRDGTTFYAVAYTSSTDKLQYVTEDGQRRSVALDLIDFDATQKSNEARGNTIYLPNPVPASSTF